MNQTRAEEITESYLNGNITWCRDELKKRNGKMLLEQVYTNLQQNMNQQEADRFRRLML